MFTVANSMIFCLMKYEVIKNNHKVIGAPPCLCIFVFSQYIISLKQCQPANTVSLCPT